METGSGSSMASCSCIPRLAGAALLLVLFLFCSCPTSAEAYGPLDPNGNITIKWDAMTWTPDGYVGVVTMYNFQQHRNIRAPGWRLGWTWAKREVIWSMVGAKTTAQGDCSRFVGNIPQCCKKDPTVVDLPQNTPYNMQIANCCKGGVLDSWVHDPANSAASFQVSVGDAGTDNRTVQTPKNFTLQAPGQGYRCGAAKIVRPTRFITPDGRRVTQALMTWKVICVYHRSLSWRTSWHDQPSRKVHVAHGVGFLQHSQFGKGS